MMRISHQKKITRMNLTVKVYTGENFNGGNLQMHLFTMPVNPQLPVGCFRNTTLPFALSVSRR